MQCTVKGFKQQNGHAFAPNTLTHPVLIGVARLFDFEKVYLLDIITKCFHLRTTERQLPYGITQVITPCLNPNQIGRYSIYLPQRDKRLSWHRWLVTYRDGLSACRQSPIQVPTRPSIVTVNWTPVAYLGRGVTVRWPPFGPTMKIFYRRLYIKRCVFAIFQQISKKWANLRFPLNIQKQKLFQLQEGFAPWPSPTRGSAPGVTPLGAPPPDPRYRLALRALAMPPLLNSKYATLGHNTLPLRYATNPQCS